MTVTVGNQIFTINDNHMDIYDFIFPCSTLYKFGSRRSLKMVFDQISKHLDIRQKIILRVLFSTLFSLLGNVVKHDLSCLNDILLATKQVPNNEKDTSRFAIPVMSQEKIHGYTKRTTVEGHNFDFSCK